MLRKSLESRVWHKEIPVWPGIFEFFSTASLKTSSEADFTKAIREIEGRLEGRVFEGVSVTAFHSVFCPFSVSESRALQKLARTAFIGWRAPDGRSFVFTGYVFESEALRNASFAKDDLGDCSVSCISFPGCKKITLDAFSSEGEFESQVDAFYDRIESVMRAKRLPPESFVRSWNYVDSILKNYPTFNRVRDRRFDAMGIERSACPAGTGIDAVLPNAGMSAFAEFHSAGESGVPKIVKYKAGPQCEALDYGPRFSRAAYVESNGWRRIHVSGTASVGSGGETLNADDIVANVAHTMETVRELLDIAGAEFSDVVRSHAYFKREEFESAFSDWKARGGWDFPTAENVCDVCRDDWLFEFECVAFVRVKRGAFERFGDDAETIGNKAENCRKLAELGFPVPPSLAIPGSALARDSRFPESGNFERHFESSLLRAFWEDFRQKRFAVRSSSSAEDSSSSSMAGAFRSEIDVPFSGLWHAVSLVRESLESNGEPFGILIQEYVPLSKFGVAFTSDPDFREHAMSVEVSEGSGEVLVSGKNAPKQFAFSRNSRIEPAVRDGIDFEFWRKTFRRIESAFFAPQDIEWGISEDGKPFVFQTRPITTLGSGEREFLGTLDRFEVERNPKGPFELVRNELCEPFDRPTADELAFLRTLYSHESVVSAYRKWGIEYRPKDFLAVVGERLFIDVQKERECFDFSGVPGFFGWWWRQKNSWNLGSVASKLRLRGEGILSELEARMFVSLGRLANEDAGPLEGTNSAKRAGGLFGSDGRFALWISELLSAHYGAVFETNFLASSWASFQKRFSFREGGHSLQNVNAPYFPNDSEKWKSLFERIASRGFLGNSLAFSDVSSFVTPLFSPSRWNLPLGEAEGFRSVSNVWGLLSDVEISARLDFLREAGRAVSVGISNAISPARTRFRTTGPNAESASAIRCPRRLLSPFFQETPHGFDWETVSAWMAEGKFVRLGSTFEAGTPLVFFVESLDPSLAVSLPESTVAVISAQGGRLSHFAIVARERGLPVFVAPGFNASKFQDGWVRVSDEGVFEAPEWL